MEKIGEKHAFFEKRKCGSRKVLRFMRSLLYALAVLSLPLRGAWIEIAFVRDVEGLAWSLPLRGAWIEMLPAKHIGLWIASLPLRGAWIEIAPSKAYPASDWSLPLRGAWIEIFSNRVSSFALAVAPPAGSVD